MNTETLEKQSNIEKQHELLRQMAKEQGVKPIENFDDIPKDLWPEDQNVDDFLDFIKELRDSDNTERSV